MAYEPEDYVVRNYEEIHETTGRSWKQMGNDMKASDVRLAEWMFRRHAAEQRSKRAAGAPEARKRAPRGRRARPAEQAAKA
jgi:hypothetical protein